MSTFFLFDYNSEALPTKVKNQIVLSALPTKPCTRNGQLGDQAIFVFCDCTDAGTDQSSRRSRTLAALAGADLPSVFYFDSNCLIHQFHLVVHQLLVSTDEFVSAAADAFPEVFRGFKGYTASLCKCINFWRENVNDFIELWERIHGPKAPEGVNYRRFPLRVITGRWGAIDVAEAFFLARTRGYLQDVLLALLSKRMKAAKPETETQQPAPKRRKTDSRPTHDAAAALMDDDSRESFRLKLSKWASGAFAAVRCSVFWLLLRVEHEIRGPLSSFFCWCQKHSNDEMLLKLVTHEADAVMRMFDKLSNTFDRWFADAVTEMAATDLPADLLAMIKAFAFKQIVAAAGSFHLRVVAVTRRQQRCTSSLDRA